MAFVGLLIAIVLPTLLGGLPFVWCVPLARVQLTCCCHAAHAEVRRESAHAPAVDAACCEGRRVDAMPTSLAAMDLDVAVPPSVWVVAQGLPALPCERGAPIEPWEHLHPHPPRAGPGPPLFALHCRYLN